jgi:hypothetical protein
MDEQELHNRAVMLRRVKNIWLKGVLEESLHGAEIIDLGLAYRPSAVAGGGVPEWQQLPEYDYLLPVGTNIADVFAAAEGELLILGEPGAGKTTMLLQLVSQLMDNAERDNSHPMPAVFSLASWRNQKTLAEWMVDELTNSYQLPRRLGRAWIEANCFVPLLDGLDEVEPAYRLECALAINEFCQQHQGVSLLVTTRVHDYQALATRLNLDKAIVLQALNDEQIDEYLAGRGRKLAGLRASLQVDPVLRELARTPLMLSIMTLAYYRMPADIAVALQDQELGRQLLFDVYVERMTRYRSGAGEYQPAETIRWLSWLAQMVTRHNKPIFFLEDMQPSWFLRGSQRRFADSFRLLVFLLLAIPALLASMFAWPVFGWDGSLVTLLLGLGAAGLPILLRRLFIGTPINWLAIETTESLDWSWPWAGLGLLVGAIAGLLPGALFNWLDHTSATPWLLLWPAGLALMMVLDNALMRGDMKLRTTPGEGLQRSWRNGRLVGLITATLVAVISLLIAWLGTVAGGGRLFPDALPWVIWLSLYLGIASGLAYGGLAYLQFRRLLALLHREGMINSPKPELLIHFLDYVAERNLLRKVGGGYTFVHALLLEYFQNRNDE